MSEELNKCDEPGCDFGIEVSDAQCPETPAKKIIPFSNADYLLGGDQQPLSLEPEQIAILCGGIEPCGKITEDKIKAITSSIFWAWKTIDELCLRLKAIEDDPCGFVNGCVSGLNPVIDGRRQVLNEFEDFSGQSGQQTANFTYTTNPINVPAGVENVLLSVNIECRAGATAQQADGANFDLQVSDKNGVVILRTITGDALPGDQFEPVSSGTAFLPINSDGTVTLNVTGNYQPTGADLNGYWLLAVTEAY